MSVRERLVRPVGKGSGASRVVRPRKPRGPKGGDHIGREGQGQVVPNQTGKQSRQPDPVTGQEQRGRLS